MEESRLKRQQSSSRAKQRRRTTGEHTCSNYFPEGRAQARPPRTPPLSLVVSVLVATSVRSPLSSLR